MLDLPMLNIATSSDARCLAHGKCVTTVKRCCDAIVTTLENSYEEYHEPEAFGIGRMLTKQLTVFAILT